jgi:hypothetical protein
MRNVCDFTGMPGKISQEYAVKVVPSYYLLDEMGKIIVKGTLKQVSEEIKKSMH